MTAQKSTLNPIKWTLILVIDLVLIIAVFLTLKARVENEVRAALSAESRAGEFAPAQAVQSPTSRLSAAAVLTQAQLTEVARLNGMAGKTLNLFGSTRVLTSSTRRSACAGAGIPC